MSSIVISRFLVGLAGTPLMLSAAINGWAILGIVVAILAVLLVVLYFWGRKMQVRQVEAESQMEAMKQVTSLLVIDKKLLKPKDSGLPAAVTSQIPWYLKNSKLPIVKAKVGPRITVLMAERKVWDILPVKQECKVTISGLYITEIKSVRGGKVPTAPAKQNIFQRIFKKKKK